MKYLLFILLLNFLNAELIKPTNLDTLSKIHVLFEWEQEPYALGYNFQISVDEFFNDIILDTNIYNIIYIDKNNLEIRTYERGVEDETLACGTGAVASSLMAAARNLVESPVNVKVRSGESLVIHFNGNPENTSDVYMEGDTRLIYTGEIRTDAFA